MWVGQQVKEDVSLSLKQSTKGQILLYTDAKYVSHINANYINLISVEIKICTVNHNSFWQVKKL